MSGHILSLSPPRLDSHGKLFLVKSGLPLNFKSFRVNITKLGHNILGIKLSYAHLFEMKPKYIAIISMTSRSQIVLERLCFVA